MAHVSAEADPRVQTAMELTHLMVQKHYCENDPEAVIAQMDEDFLWFGAGEQEYLAGKSAVAETFRQFVGQVPRCNISDEEYHVICIAPDAYVCTGRMWIATDPSTRISLRVHQRISTVFRWVNGQPRCCHVHISNPYTEMSQEDVGFPTKMAQQSYQYLQEQIEAQKRQIAAQTAILQRMSYEDTLTGLYNRNRFNQLLQAEPADRCRLGVACFDLNGLKEINDRLGHSAGDLLICRAASQIRQFFEGRAYRTGGDEFVVVDEAMDKNAFQAAVRSVEEGMDAAGISHSAGFSWRCSQCSVREQFDEADHMMYEAKRHFYSVQGHDRRRRRE